MKNMKRIHSVTIKRMIDESPDTSWLGEYSNRATSEYSIDRAHNIECDVNNPPIEAIEKVDHILAHLFAKRGLLTNGDDSAVWQAIDEACDILGEAKESLEACDCDERGDMTRGEYQYFNPSFNYVDKQGNAKDLTPEEVRKYTRQDYERMEALNRGDWCFIGISAEAEYSIDSPNGSPIQTVTSGGLWGIESDSDAAFFAETEQEQLSELRDQLHAIEFSKRAIATAFKTIERQEN